MPSAKVLETKQQIVAELADKIKNSQAGVLVDYKGITVADDTKLRAELRKAGVEYAVIKNTLIKRACESAGYEMSNVLEGMTAIAISPKDPVAAAKILCSYDEKVESFSVKAGYLQGEVLDVAGVQTLSKLPPKEELVAKALGSLMSPISGLVTVLNGNLSGLARVLQSIADKKSA